MKITKTELRQIIKEELKATLSEDIGEIAPGNLFNPGDPGYSEAGEELFNKMAQAKALLQQVFPEYKKMGPHRGKGSNPYALLPHSLEALERIIDTFEHAELV